MSYRFWGNIKALFHFDYPYYHEPGDGLKDEVSGRHDIFVRSGAIKLAGNETSELIIPASTGPKFGYRCLASGSANDFIVSGNADLINLIKTKNCEIEFFVKFAASNNAQVFSLANSSDNIFAITQSEASVLITGGNMSYAVSLNTWIHFKLKISSSSIKLFVNGTERITAAVPDLNYLTTIKIGGINGYYDELVFRQGNSNDIIPAVPYQADLNINSLGNFNDGSLGDVVITSNSIINSYALVTSASGSSLTLSNWYNGKFGTPKAGDEIMLHVTAKKNSTDDLLGLYSLRKIKSVNQNTLTLENTVDEFDLSNAIQEYYVQVIFIPAFKNFTINQGITIRPLTYSSFNHYGGIIAFRAKNSCNVNGNIISMGYGPARSDLLQMTHGDLIDRFLINSGGGIFITCGGTFTSSSSARIGATWDGSASAGIGQIKASGTNGGAGYGGGGGGDNDSKTKGGDGGVGGGGGGHDSSPGHDYSYGGNAGVDDTTGGYGYDSGVKNNSYIGGTQGVTQGAVGTSKGGGGALGNGGQSDGAWSGACLILIAKILNADISSISTGGKRGAKRSYTPAGGGGTGMCYIACQNVR